MAEALDRFSDLELTDEEGEEQQKDVEFSQACEYLKKLVSKLDSATLLKFYGYFKQATEGACNTQRPMWIAIQAKQKWDAWNALGDLPSDDAKQAYINLLTEIEPHWNDSEKKDEKGETWVSVSTMSPDTDTHLEDHEKSVYDFCQENNVNAVMESISKNPELLTKLDENGLALIHWASDRGHLPMLRALIEAGCNVDIVDDSGQTPLHYAVSCSHAECVKFLINAGANPNLKDEDGISVFDLCTDNLDLLILLDCK